MILYVGNKLIEHGFTPTGIDTLSMKLLEEGYKVKCVSNKRNIYLRFIDILLSIIRYRKETSFLLIDTYSTLNFYYALAAAILAKFLKIPYAPILRGGNLPEKIKSSKKLCDIIFCNSYVNIAPSNYLFKSLSDVGYKVMLIPNNIEIELYDYKKRESFAPRLLYVRSFHKIYNPKMAVYVFERILKKYPDAELYMVGPEKDGSQKITMALAKELGIFDKIKFPGRLPKDEIRAMAKDFDIFINTTDFDNTPVSVIEAMALGLPVVSTNVGGVPFIIENEVNGILVQPNNVDDFTAAIESILDNPNLGKNLATNARKSVEIFGWDVVKNNWRDLLKEFPRLKTKTEAKPQTKAF